MLDLVSNITDLKNYSTSSLNTGDTIIVSGYYSLGDGGGGNFFWDGASTETDNGGTIIEPTGGGTGRWIRESNNGVINVRWFGAKGDGITDDTNKIQTAINYINALPLGTQFSTNVGGTLKIPRGDYVVTTITLKQGVTLNGDGARSTRLKGTGTSSDFIITCDASSEVLHSIGLFGLRVDCSERANGVNIIGFNETCSLIDFEIAEFTCTGLKIQADVSPSTRVTQNTGFQRIRLIPSDNGANKALELIDVKRCTFQSLTVDQTPNANTACGIGLDLVSGSNENVFLNCHFEDCGLPISIGSSGLCNGNIFMDIDWQNPHSALVSRTFNGKTGTFGIIIYSGTTEYTFLGLRNASSPNYILEDAEKNKSITGTNGNFFTQIFSSSSQGTADLFVVNGNYEVGKLVEPFISLNNSTDSLDVNVVSTIGVNTSSPPNGNGSVSIGGLSNGVTGQRVSIFKTTSANNLTIKHNDSLGDEKIITPDGSDIVVTNYGGVNLVYNGANWFVVSV